MIEIMKAHSFQYLKPVRAFEMPASFLDCSKNETRGVYVFDYRSGYYMAAFEAEYFDIGEYHHD